MKVILNLKNGRRTSVVQTKDVSYDSFEQRLYIYVDREHFYIIKNVAPYEANAYINTLYQKDMLDLSGRNASFSSYGLYKTF